MNQQYISFLAVALVNVLPMLGVSVANDQVTAFVQVGASIVFAVWGIISGWRSGVHTLGGRSIE